MPRGLLYSADMKSPHDEPKAWSGWYRPHRLAKWRKLVSGPTQRGVLLVLTDMVHIGRDNADLSGEMMVLPAGIQPEGAIARADEPLPPIARRRYRRH